MEVVPDHPLIKLTYEDVQRTRKHFGLEDVKSVNESLNAVQEWAKKQEHLAAAVEAMSRTYLERLLILARGSVEGTKTKVEKLCTSRGLMPEMCLNNSVDEFDKLLECVNILPLPKLSPTDHTRTLLTRFIEGKMDNFNILSYFRYSFMVGEYRLNYDYCVGERFVLDLKNINHLAFLAKVNPIIVKKAEILCTEGYGTKIKGIHLLNVPPFVDKIIFLLKQALKEKVASRIHVHHTYEDLHKHVPKEILPKDYGGDETSSEKLAEQWKEALRSEEALKIIERINKLVTDESKRDSAKFNEEYMGMPGSFRRLNVD